MGKTLWVLLCIVALGPGVQPVPAALAQEPDTPLLFVQSGKALDVTHETITLLDASQKTTWVTDRPERLVGRISNETFAENWDDGPDSFAVDPPNAIVTVGGRPPVIVVLTDISVGLDRISYDYELLSGRFPYKSEPTTIVIDNEALDLGDMRVCVACVPYEIDGYFFCRC